MAIEESFREQADFQKLPIALCLAVGVLMLCAKVCAYRLTGSAAILSDASESVVHVLAVSFAAYSLRLSWKPTDQSHNYGYDKIVFFSAGLEGLLIILAAAYVIFVSVHKWIAGAKPDNLGSGLGMNARRPAHCGAHLEKEVGKTLACGDGGTESAQGGA